MCSDVIVSPCEFNLINGEFIQTAGSLVRDINLELLLNTFTRRLIGYEPFPNRIAYPEEEQSSMGDNPFIHNYGNFQRVLTDNDLGILLQNLKNLEKEFAFEKLLCASCRAQEDRKSKI